LQTLGQAVAGLRTKLGESHLSVQKYDKPLEEATTSSLEALQAFSDGNRVSESGEAASVPFFERALELDPNFLTAAILCSFRVEQQLLQPHLPDIRMLQRALW
jgi:hypothetical protein